MKEVQLWDLTWAQMTILQTISNKRAPFQNKSVLRRAGKGSDKANADIIKIENIEINLREGKVRKNGEDLFLTTLEYRLPSSCVRIKVGS